MSEMGNRSVSRALGILERLAAARQPMTLKEISDQLELPKSSALVLLRALREHDFVECDEAGRYSVGLRAFETGSAYARGMSTVRAASDQLRLLTTSLGVSAHFAVLDGDEVVYVAKEDPDELTVRLASFVGARLPAAQTAVGTAQLAHHPMRAHLVSADSSLAQRMADVITSGYAVDEGAILTGVRCVAAAVMDQRGCCGAIGVSFLQQADLPLDDVARSVVEAAATASARLGGRAANVGVA